MEEHDSALTLEGMDFSHLRLLDLTRLADLAEPFYRWVETTFQRETSRADSLHAIVNSATVSELASSILACYRATADSALPKLFDGGGVPYKHRDACFFFFSWLARDAASQRLKPLLGSALRGKKVNRIEFEAQVLATLLFTYKDNLQHFEWPSFREVAIQRLEGSRRAKKGSAVEIFVRTALTEAFSAYFSENGHYGSYRDFDILDKPLKIRNRTYDVAAVLKSPDDTERYIVMPVKTRETQGGGHAHLFSRDVEQANQDILSNFADATIFTVIIAQNWAMEEITHHEELHGTVFYFDVNPNVFIGFDDSSQQRLNEAISRELTR